MIIIQGLDVERIIQTLTNIKDETSKQIAILTCLSDYRIETINHSHNVRVESSDGSHGHGSGAHHHDFILQGNHPTGGSGLVSHVSDQLTYPGEYKADFHPTHKHIEPSIIYEREHKEIAAEFTGTIIGLGEALNDDIGKMQKIENNMYTNTETFNNSYGSPWKEIYILKEKIDQLKDYAIKHFSLQWIGEKYAMLNLMQIVLSYSIDAKWAITHYQDYMQRGYDNQFNNNEASITRDDFERGASIGNRDQNISGNVNVKRESNDPF